MDLMDSNVQQQVVNILVEDPILYDRRNEFYIALDLPQSEIAQINIQLAVGLISVKEIFSSILRKWVSVKGKEATVENLESIMRNLKFGLIADKIADAFQPSSMLSAGRFFEIDHPTRTFVGRSKELDQLNELFNNPSTVFVKLIGMGGVGKSELAKSFANSKRSDVNGIWLNAESPQSLWISITQLANKLRVPLTTNNQLRDVTDIFSDLISAITKKHRLKVIIVIDNVDIDNADVKRIIEIMHTTFQSQCFPVVTSRYFLAAGIGDEVISLDGLETEDAHKLITNSLKDEDAEHISTLCNLLHNFPLALQQAVAYIKERKLTSAKGDKYNILNYLDAYEDQHATLLDFPVSEIELKDKNTTLVTWTTSMEHIKNTAKAGTLAIQFLNLFAYFEADGITIDFISRIHANVNKPEEKHATNDFKIQRMWERFKKLTFRSNYPHYNEAEEFNVTDALQLLKAYSLIKIENGVISIHRLIQQVSRINLKSSNQEVQILTKCLEWIDTTDDSLTPTDMPHVLSVWKYSTAYTDLIIKFSNLSNKIANKLSNMSLYRELQRFTYFSYTKLNTVFGDKHIETLKMESYIAEALRLNGKYADALEKFEIVLLKMKLHLGEEHEQTLVTRHHMALTLYNLKRYDEAMELLKSVLESEIRVLGETHTYTMHTKHEIASVLSLQGKNEEAMNMNEDLLEWKMAELGEEHRDTLTTNHNIAHCMYNQGEYEKAKTLFQQVLDLRVKVLGEEHSSTLSSKYMLGVTLHIMGESEVGLKMLKEVLISREKVLGAEHPATISIRNDIDLIISKTHPISQ